MSREHWLQRARRFEEEAVGILSKASPQGVRHKSQSRSRTSVQPIVAIGHGRSPMWLILRDFLEHRLGLKCDEFNRESAAGIPISDRLRAMAENADFAFVVMTAEDEMPDGTVRARENVIHEAGFFQGVLGFRKAVVLLEEGCNEFSNIHGLGQIRFPKDSIIHASEEIRKVLEREQIIR